MTSSPPTPPGDTQDGPLEHWLRAQLQRVDCPSPQALGEFHLDLLPDEAAQQIAAHLDDCARCRAEVSDLRAFLTVERAPGATQDAAPERPTPDAPCRRLPRPGEIIARLLPPTPTPALALRGDTRGPVVVEADSITLFLEQDAASDPPALQGQVVADDITPWIGALVQVHYADMLQASAVVDDAGSFRATLAASADEPVKLRIAAEDGTVLVVPGITFADEA